MKRIAFTAGDDAAGDGFLAVCLVQHPQFAIRHEFVLGGGVAVGQRQIAAALHLDNTAAAGHLQHLAVQVQRHSAVDRQRGVNVNVRRQLDGVEINISNSCSQFFRGADFCCRLAPAN